MVMSHIYLKFFVVCTLIAVSYSSCPGTLPTVKFNEGFRVLSGNVSVSGDGDAVTLFLRNGTGSSGFITQNNFTKGLFSATIKLPSQKYTGGIVATFYLSNIEQYPIQHDDIDFEFLGHTEDGTWVVLTNFFGNGSTQRGREEKYKLWFDPSMEAHKYSIFWSENQITWYIDDIPIRTSRKVGGMGGDYPSKPMSLHATLWDGSSWATGNGTFKANFTSQPFVSEYSGLGFSGCRVDPSRNVPDCGGWDLVKDCGNITPKQLQMSEEFRKKCLTYSYCLDKSRYSPPLPECLVKTGSGKSV